MTYREAIAHGEAVLGKAGIEDAKNDSWLLLVMVCKIDRTFYFTHIDEEMEADKKSEFITLIAKRAERIPLQYITGEQEFMGLNFHVNENVLVPRQDTETLVEEALKLIEPKMRVLDMCTGSGCIIISLAKNCPDIKAVATDISKQALIVAKENAKLNNVFVEFERGDLFNAVEGEFDMIVSNPPYIKTEDIEYLMPEVAQYEPIGALDGKEDGLYFYRRIVDEARSYLKEGGVLLFEIGYDQGKDVRELLIYAGYKNVRVIKDLSDNDRVVIAER